MENHSNFPKIVFYSEVAMFSWQLWFSRYLYYIEIMVCICGLLGQELGSLTDDRRVDESHEGSRWKMKRNEFDLHSTILYHFYMS